jgi:hypothetical protein
VVSGEGPPGVARPAPGILRAAGLGDRRVTRVTRLAGGSKKGVYRLECDDGFSAVLYVEQRAARVGKVADVAAPGACAQAQPAPPGDDGASIVLVRALRHLARAADRVPSIAAARPRLEDRLRALAAGLAPRAEYALIHGELGPDHVLLDDRGMPVVVDIEGAMYFDAEWEHAFLRLHFGRHYRPLALKDLDQQRMRLYALAQDLSLIEGPLRLLDGDYPDRDEMLAIAGWATERALSAANAPAR